MSTSDFYNTLLQTVISLTLPFILMLFYKFINLFEEKLKINLTDQQKATVQGAINTGAGLIENAVKMGYLDPKNITVSNPFIKNITDTAMVNVQESANALTVTPKIATQMIIARHAQITNGVQVASSNILRQ